MRRLPCPFLPGDVELTDERLAHIRAGHPELITEAVDRIARTLSDPDEIRTDPRFAGTHLISRWFDDLLGGKIMVVAVVVDETRPHERRHWVVTAYVTRRLSQGVVEWSRP